MPYDGTTMLIVASLLLGQFAPIEPPSPPRMPKVVLRQQWGAKPVGPRAKRHEIRLITIHHTGVAQNPKRSLEDKLRGLQAFSQREDKLADGRTKPAWPDIPYHYYISTDGRIGEGREWFYAGDTNTEYDPTGHLLIVVEGNFEIEKPLPAQMKSLREITLWAAHRWRVAPELIEGHKDHSAQTSCPGKSLDAQLSALRRWVRIRL